VQETEEELALSRQSRMALINAWPNVSITMRVELRC